MATVDECMEFALKNIGLWWRYGISRHCDAWKYIIIGRIFESEIILIPPSLKISESSSNGSYRNTDEVWWRYGISRSCDEWRYCVSAIFFTCMLFTWWFIIVVLVYLGLFLIYIKYLKLLTIENTVLIFQFYK
jgi:hypothetical protein